MEEIKKPEVAEPAQDQAAKDLEFQGRIKDFNAEIMPILKKYHLGIGASAFLMPDGRIGAGPRLYDDTPKTEDPAGSTAAPAAKLAEG